MSEPPDQQRADDGWTQRLLATAIELSGVLLTYTRSRNIYGDVPDKRRALEMHRQLVDLLDYYLGELGVKDLFHWIKPHFENTTDRSLLEMVAPVLQQRLMNHFGWDPIEDEGRAIVWVEENAVQAAPDLLEHVRETLMFDCREPLERAGAVYVSPERALFMLGKYWEFYSALLLQHGKNPRPTSLHPMLRYIVNVKSRIESCLDRIAKPELAAAFRETLDVRFERDAADAWAERVTPLVARASEAYEASRLGIRAASFDLTDAEAFFLNTGLQALKDLDATVAADLEMATINPRRKTSHEMIREVELALRAIIVAEAKQRRGNHWLAEVERLLGDGLAKARETMLQRKFTNPEEIIHFTNLADVCRVISDNFGLYAPRLGMTRKEFNKQTAEIVKGRTEEAHNRPEHIWPDIEKDRVRVACYDLIERIRRAQPPNAPVTKRVADTMVRDHEAKAAPLVEFELGNLLQVMGWDHAKVPLVVHNISTHAVTITSATLEFWAIPGGTLQSEERPDLVGVVEVGHPKMRDFVIPLQRIPESERPEPRGGTKRIAFRVLYTVRGVTGVEVPGCSREFNL